MRSALTGRRVVIIGASLALFACGSNPLGPVPERLLSEAWEWQSACCGFAGDTRTPATEGYSYVLRFHENGTVRADRNGTLLLETTFRVRRVSPTDFADEMTTITYGDPLPLGPGIEPVSRHMLMMLGEGRLLLRSLDGCADCFGDWEFLARLETSSDTHDARPSPLQVLAENGWLNQVDQTRLAKKERLGSPVPATRAAVSWPP